MPAKKSPSTAKPQLDVKTTLKFEEVLRKALASSNIVVTVDNLSGRFTVMVDDISGRIVVVTDNISGRIIVATVDNISGRLTGSKASVAKRGPLASKTKESTKRKK